MSNLFSNCQLIKLNEDNAGSNYETYRGIIFDPEKNAFKVVEGKFRDKKDMYEKMVKQGYVLRKCFEKKIFDWIEENSPSNLIAYLMYSTAFSKWRNNNLLSDYYVKLLNDIPAINREGRKGDPQSRGKKNMGGFGEAFLNELNNTLEEGWGTKETHRAQNAEKAKVASSHYNDYDPDGLEEEHNITLTVVDENGNAIRDEEGDPVSVSFVTFADIDANDPHKIYEDPVFWRDVETKIKGNDYFDLAGFEDYYRYTYTPDPENPSDRKRLTDENLIEKYKEYLKNNALIQQAKRKLHSTGNSDFSDAQFNQLKNKGIELKNSIKGYNIEREPLYIKMEDFGSKRNPNVKGKPVLLNQNDEFYNIKDFLSLLYGKLKNSNYVPGINNQKAKRDRLSKLNKEPETTDNENIKDLKQELVNTKEIQDNNISKYLKSLSDADKKHIADNFINGKRNHKKYEINNLLEIVNRLSNIETQKEEIKNNNKLKPEEKASKLDALERETNFIANKYKDYASEDESINRLLNKVGEPVERKLKIDNKVVYLENEDGGYDSYGSVQGKFAYDKKGKILGIVKDNKIYNKDGNEVKSIQASSPLYSALKTNLSGIKSTLEKEKESLETPIKLSNIDIDDALNNHIDQIIDNNPYAFLDDTTKFKRKELETKLKNAAGKEDTNDTEKQAIQRFTAKGKTFDSTEDWERYNELGKILNREKYGRILKNNNIETRKDLLNKINDINTKLSHADTLTTDEVTNLSKVKDNLTYLLKYSDDVLKSKYLDYEFLPSEEVKQLKSEYNKLAKSANKTSKDTEAQLSKDKLYTSRPGNPKHGVTDTAFLNSLDKLQQLDPSKRDSFANDLSGGIKKDYENLVDRVNFFRKQKDRFENGIKKYYAPLVKNKKWLTMPKEELKTKSELEINKVKELRAQYKELIKWAQNNNLPLTSTKAKITLDEKNPEGLKSMFDEVLNRLNTNFDKAQQDLHKFNNTYKPQSKEDQGDFSNLLHMNTNSDELDQLHQRDVEFNKFLNDYDAKVADREEKAKQARIAKLDKVKADNEKTKAEIDALSNFGSQIKDQDFRSYSDVMNALNKSEQLTTEIDDLHNQMIEILETSDLPEEEIIQIQDDILAKIADKEAEVQDIDEKVKIYLSRVEKHKKQHGKKEEAAFVNQGVNTLDNEEKYGDNVFFEDGNKSLNEKLFDITNDKLKPDVKEALLKVAETFKQKLDLPFEPVDIYFTGSNANYNYNDQSDIDLHLVFDFEKAGMNAEMLSKYLKEAKTVFNSQYDIKVKGLPVEVGCENTAEPLVTSGIYSVLNDNWVVQPTNNYPADASFEQAQYDEITNEIEDAIETKDSSTIGALWKMLGALRKDSLASEGEYGKGNLLFKKLRNMDYLKRLKDAYYNSASRELSLEAWDNDLNDTDINRESKSAEGYASEMPKTKQPRLRDIYNKAVKQLSEDLEKTSFKPSRKYGDDENSVDKLWHTYVSGDANIAKPYNPRSLYPSHDEQISFTEFGLNPDYIIGQVLPNDMKILGIDKLYEIIPHNEIPNFEYIKSTSANLDEYKEQIAKALNLPVEQIFVNPLYKDIVGKKRNRDDIKVYCIEVDPAHPYYAKPHCHIQTMPAKDLEKYIKNTNKSLGSAIDYDKEKFLTRLNGSDIKDIANTSFSNESQEKRKFYNTEVEFNGETLPLNNILPKMRMDELYGIMLRSHEDIQTVFDRNIYTPKFQQSILDYKKQKDYKIVDDQLLDKDGNIIGTLVQNKYFKNSKGKIIAYLDKQGELKLVATESLNEADDGTYKIDKGSDAKRIARIFAGDDDEISLPEEMFNYGISEEQYADYGLHQNALLFSLPEEAKYNMAINLSNTQELPWQLNALIIDSSTNKIVGFELKCFYIDKPDAKIRAKHSDKLVLRPKAFAKRLAAVFEDPDYGDKVQNAAREARLRGGEAAKVRINSLSSLTGNGIKYNKTPLSPEEVIMLLNYFETLAKSDKKQEIGDLRIDYFNNKPVTVSLYKYFVEGSDYNGTPGGKNFLARCYKDILCSNSSLAEMKNDKRAKIVQAALNRLSGLESLGGPGKGQVRMSVKRLGNAREGIDYLTFIIEQMPDRSEDRFVPHHHPESPFRDYTKGYYK